MKLYKVDMNDLGTAYYLVLGVYERRLHMLYKHDDEEAIWLYEKHNINYLDDMNEEIIDIDDLKSIEKQNAIIKILSNGKRENYL